MTDPPSGFNSTDAAFAVIEKTPGVLRLLLEDLEAVVSAGDPRGDPRGEWGPRQVLEHLLDVEDVAFAGRIARIVDEDRPFIRSIDPSGRLAEGGYAVRSIDDLLGELERRRREDVARLQLLGPADLDREGEHEQAGRITAGELVHYWACHDLLHLRQLAGGLQEVLAPFVGNVSMFFEDV